VSPACAAEARVALARTGFLRADELGFVHPVVREGVHADLLGGVRGDWHRRAARLRADAGADADELAAHLMLTDPSGEDRAADALAAAGRRALLAGSPEAAVSLLRRALAEPPAAPALPAVLLALGHAEARTGDEGALGHLARAAELGDPELAARADRLRAQVLLLHERAGESVEVLRGALADARLRDPARAEELEDDLVDVLAHHEPALGEYRRHLEATASDGRPTLLAHLAFSRAITGAPASEVLDLARRALAVPAPAGRGRFMHYYAFEALMIVEAAAESEAALREATALARREGSRVVAGPLTYMTSSWAAWERAFGDLRRAEEQAREGLELMTAAGAPAVVVTLRSTLAAVLLDRGRVEEADAELALLPPREAGPGLKEVHAIRARLRLVQGRAAEAMAELDTELELERRRGWTIANRDPSRATLVAVLLALGRHEEAREAADAELTSAQRRGVAGAQARARLTRALTLPGPAALDELRAAADVAQSSPSRLVQAQALAELGSALRRAGDRVGAREPLARAREVAHACGATGLERRAHEELVVAGAKPRRIALSGTDALTAAERRVAELAAQGIRNRQIAETLFVSLKTVEVHLSRVYGKLGIKSRTQLADALAG
jgi:DNA-binding CsgD family transcriptional regulator